MTPSRKRLVLGAFVVLVAAVVLLGVVLGQRGGGSPVASTTTVTTTASPTTTAPSTTTPFGTTAARPSSAASTTSSVAPTTSATPSAVAPSLVSVVVTVSSYNPAASDVEFGAFVQGVVETGGSCVVTMRKGTLTATGRATALPNAKNTSCGDLRVLGTAVSTGSWTATVAYTSPISSGSSAPTTVEVP